MRYTANMAATEKDIPLNGKILYCWCTVVAAAAALVAVAVVSLFPCDIADVYPFVGLVCCYELEYYYVIVVMSSNRIEIQTNIFKRTMDEPYANNFFILRLLASAACCLTPLDPPNPSIY